MDDGARGWLIKTARKNLWRVVPIYDLDDLIQEGYLWYAYIINRYPDAVEPEHIMSLFKLCFSQQIHEIANKRTRRSPESCFSDIFNSEDASPSEMAEILLESLRDDGSHMDFSLRLSRAPDYVLDALKLFTEPESLEKLRSVRVFSKRAKKRPRRETTNERLCRLTGYDPKSTNIVGMMKYYLLGDSSDLSKEELDREESERWVLNVMRSVRAALGET